METDSNARLLVDVVKTPTPSLAPLLPSLDLEEEDKPWRMMRQTVSWDYHGRCYMGSLRELD